MIRFEILESLNFRGGNHYCYFSADSTSEVLEALKDAWYGSGLSRHGGELFLYAYLHDADGNEEKLFFGNCTVDKEDEIEEVFFNFKFIENEDECKPWNTFGLFSADVTDDFEEVLIDLFNYDSPDRVIGAYLFKVWDKFDNLPSHDKDNFDAALLANILDFGKKEQKLIPLFQWIISEDGLKYFDRLQCSIDFSSPEIIVLDSSSSAEDLDNFIERYKRNFGVTIYLPSTV